MGQILVKYNYEFGLSLVANRRASAIDRRTRRRYHPLHRSVIKPKCSSTFVDLKLLPPEIALNILSNLGATDLCLASCVWHDLACDDVLWENLCHQTWPFCSAYKRDLPESFSYRQLYLRLDEARLTFNADAFEGIEYMKKYGLLDDDTDDIVSYFQTAPGLDPVQRRRFLQSNPFVLDRLMELKSYHNHVLPNALRRLFREMPVPVNEPETLDFISSLVSKFSERFVACNPNLGFTVDEVYVLCFSLIMLSVDLWSPHVKNKMSKREFIRNTRHVARAVRDDFLGNLYDNVYMVGHVVLSDLPSPASRHPDIRTILV